MELILIDGGPASGKNTLGELLQKKLVENNNPTVLVDLDTFVEELNPKWIWDNEIQKEKDQLNARLSAAHVIDNHLQGGKTVIFIGERFLSKDDVIKFVSKLKTKPHLQLFHLSIPFKLRNERLNQRGPDSLIDLAKDQNDRDKVRNWPGFIYENINTPEIDSINLLSLIENDNGYISILTFE